MTENPFSRTERRLIGFCPNSPCVQRIIVVSVREPGNFNDAGIVIASCDACGGDLSVETVNPDSVRIDGASVSRVVAVREDDDEGENWPAPVRDLLLASIEAPDEPVHNAASINLFHCDACGSPVEEAVQAVLAARWPEVNTALHGIYQGYLKGMCGDPEFTVVRGICACDCDQPLAFTAYRKFRPKTPVIDAVGDLLLASVAGAETFAELDGVFTRDECEALLTKLMYRWRLLFPSAVVATPFVGFSFGRKDKFGDIWDRFLALIEPTSVTLVTRKRTITDYRTASEEDGVDFAVLEKYGLLHPTLNHYVKESHFHAKFYAAIDEAGDRVEALTGSFNFQEGRAMENVLLKPYSIAQFRRRYLDKLGVPNAIAARKTPRCIVVDLGDGPARANVGRLCDIAP